MPGDNCAVFGCGTNRRTKGVGIFKLPVAKNEEYKKWRADWLNQITKSRVVDKDFRERMKNDRVFTCEKHFKLEEVEICKSPQFLNIEKGKKSLSNVHEGPTVSKDEDCLLVMF
eukprot:gene17183-18912_t